MHNTVKTLLRSCTMGNTAVVSVRLGRLGIALLDSSASKLNAFWEGDCTSRTARC